MYHQSDERAASSRTLCLVAFLVVCGASCAHDPAVISDEKGPSPLLVVAGGTDVRRSAEYDGTTSYKVEDPYPGSVFRARLAEQLSSMGWTKSQETFLSLAGGDNGPVDWRRTKEGGQFVTELDEGWKNNQGDLVTYILRYRGDDTGVNGHLEVQAVLTKAATVARLRRAAAQK